MNFIDRHILKEFDALLSKYHLSSTVHFEGEDKHIQTNELYSKFKRIADELKYPYVPTFVKTKSSGDFYNIQNYLFAKKQKTVACKGDVEVFEAKNKNQEIDALASKIFFEVESGKKIAIVGPTGCGKTTLINLIMRFYDVKNGAISLDFINSSNNQVSADIRNVTRQSLRSCYGMVLQDTWLKSGTIKENILIGKPDATDEEIVAAAKAAHAHSFIKRLPNGYDTRIGEDGGSLSQGQKQLLCITRVMLCMPPMLILDEATSSIDTRTEQKIQSAFNKIMQGRTSFIVAHRLSTIRTADTILVMKDGNVIEKGNHENLIAQNGFYSTLYAAGQA